MRYALLLLLVGCMAPERLDTGPEVRVRVRPESSSSVTSDETNPTITLRTTETMYMMTIDIETTDGEREEMGTFDHFDVERVEGTASVPDVTLPALAFMKDSPSASTFDGTTPIAIPASAKGKAMTITARGFDTRGLSSNLVQFDVALR